MFDKPIISRSVGVISSLDQDQKGLHIYRNAVELKDLLKRDSFENVNYDKSIFSPEIFEEKIISIADSSL